MAFKPNATKKILNFIVLLDTSGSMGGDSKSKTPSRISMVNTAMHKLETSLDKFAKDNNEIDVRIRVITFSAGKAVYHMGSQERSVNVRDYKWTDIPNENCDGDTPLGEAIELANRLFDDTNGRSNEALGTHIAYPFMLLISDGAENGNIKSADALYKLESTLIGKRCVRVSLALDIDDEDALKSLENFGKGGCIKVNECTPSVIENVINAIVVRTVTRLSKLKGDSSDPNAYVKASLEEKFNEMKDCGDLVELR